MKEPVDDGFKSYELDELGVHMFFDDVTNESCRDLAEFIIKANFTFSKDTTLTIMVNSVGGDIFSGYAAIDTMHVSRLPIRTVAIGGICSMATLITTSGTIGERIMTKNTYVMTHQFASSMEGKYHELIAVRKSQDDLHRRFIKHYTGRTKMTEKQVKDVLLGSSDKWLTAKEALKYGICDKIQQPWS